MVSFRSFARFFFLLVFSSVLRIRIKLMRIRILLVILMRIRILASYLSLWCRSRYGPASQLPNKGSKPWNSASIGSYSIFDFGLPSSNWCGSWSELSLSFDADADPTFQFYVDSDPDPQHWFSLTVGGIGKCCFRYLGIDWDTVEIRCEWIQAFNDQKYLFFIKNYKYLSLGLH